MSKIFIFLSSFFMFFSLLIFVITLINVELLEDFDCINYLNIIIFPMFGITVYNARKIKLNVEHKFYQRMLNLLWFFGLLAALFLLLSFFNGHVFKKEEEFFEVISRKSIQISKVLFLEKFKLILMKNSSGIFCFSYGIFFINFFTIKKIIKIKP